MVYFARMRFTFDTRWSARPLVSKCGRYKKSCAGRVGACMHER